MSLHSSATLAVIFLLMAIEGCALVLSGVVSHASVSLPFFQLLSRFVRFENRQTSASEYAIRGYESRLLESVQQLSLDSTDKRPPHHEECFLPPLSHSALLSLHMSQEHRKRQEATDGPSNLG